MSSEIEQTKIEKREKAIQTFLETYDPRAGTVFFSSCPAFIQTDIRVIEKFAQFHAVHPNEERFHFSLIPDAWYTEHMSTSEGIAQLLGCAKNTDQLSYIVQSIGAYTDIPQERTVQACTLALSTDISSENKAIISCILSTIRNDIDVTEENYTTLLESLKDDTLSPEEKQEIRQSLRTYCIKNNIHLTESLSD